MHKAQGPTLLEDSGRSELVSRGCGGAQVQVGKSGREPEVSLAQDGRRARQFLRSPRSRASLSKIDCETAGGARAGTRDDASPVGSIASSAIARTSSLTRNGTPPVNS